MSYIKKSCVMISLALSLVCYSGFIHSAPSSAESYEGASQTEIIPFNINTADVETISDLMNGVGHKKAQAIIDYRIANGPFENLEEMLAVKGIGKVIISKNKEAILFN